MTDTEYHAKNYTRGSRDGQATELDPVAKTERPGWLGKGSGATCAAIMPFPSTLL